MITLTDNAQKTVLEYIAGNENFEGKVLRIFVQGGGCSGFEYGFTFSDKKEGDEVTSLVGFDVAIDAASMPYLKGAVVDFVEGLQGKGFTVQNPNASGSCGCGQSFSV